VLAFALIGFLVSLPFTGLAPLWDSGVPTTPVLLLAAAGAVGLINAVIGDGKAEGSQNRVLRASALALSLAILPLAAIAAISMGTRIEQYGFTPDRIWGLLAVVVASFYGVAYLLAVMRNAKALLDWDDDIRPANVRIAVGLCGVVLFLALPILDFGAVSARDQLARLKSGATKAAEFDWQAMAFQFGPKGRAELRRLAKTGTAEQKDSARLALAAKDHWQIAEEIPSDTIRVDRTNFSFQPAAKRLDEDSMFELVAAGKCRLPCRVVWLDEQRILVVGKPYKNSHLEAQMYHRNARAGQADQPSWTAIADQSFEVAPNGQDSRPDLTPQSVIEVRTVERQQVFVDGRPVGGLIAK
jgi:hypothetical protein